MQHCNIATSLVIIIVHRIPTLTKTVCKDPDRPPIKTTVASGPHPSRGGNAYSIDARIPAVVQFVTGKLQRPVNQGLQQLQLLALKRTLRRYMARYRALGHLLPFRKSGNRKATILHGLDLLLLAVFRAAHPKATQAEIRALLWNSYGRLLPVPHFYTNSKITHAEQRLEMTRKRAAKTPRQAMLPRNKIKRFNFWNLPWPHGIADISILRMWDLDEFALQTMDCDQHHGVGLKGAQVTEPGPYGREGKISVVMAVRARPGALDRFVKYIEDRPGMEIIEFYDFVQTILTTIGPGAPGNRHCFMMDNLTAHKHPMVLQLILDVGHLYAFRAPYHPMDGPIEYVFDTIENALRICMHEIHTLEDAKNATHDIINSIENFYNYFYKVGFR